MLWCVVVVLYCDIVILNHYLIVFIQNFCVVFGLFRIILYGEMYDEMKLLISYQNCFYKIYLER